MYPGNFYNAPKISGSKPSITNNINIKNVNIINCNESNLFNSNINNNKLLFNQFNVNNNLNNNIINNNISNFYEQNKFINYSGLVEYNNINNNFQNNNNKLYDTNINLTPKQNSFDLYI